MESKEFADFGKAAVDFIVNYTTNLRNRSVLPNVEPGYLCELIPKEAPEKSESWQDVLRDMEKVILPGITHWNSPNFYAYYPVANSYPAIVGELMCAGLGVVGFSWSSSPACTELEVVTMNWLGKMLGLPEEFLNCSEGPGGGAIEGSASETILICLLAAKKHTVKSVKSQHPEMENEIIKTKLVAYTSDQSNLCVEKAGLLGSIMMRLLPVDEKYSLRGDTLLEAIKKDKEAGLIPCYVVVTLGTTDTGAFDNLSEIGPICKDYNIWLHVDAAYAGATFICPEHRHLMVGVEYADSFNFNPHKLLLTNLDCSAMWVKDAEKLTSALKVDRPYLIQDGDGRLPDYRHWQISLSRRFRSLKLWFVMRLYGVEGLQRHIRHTIDMAKRFEDYLKADNRFEIVTERSLGLICFRLKGENSLTHQLHDRLMARKRIYLTTTFYREKFVIRFSACSRLCQSCDIDFAWSEVKEQSDEVVSLTVQKNQHNFPITEVNIGTSTCSKV